MEMEAPGAPARREPAPHPGRAEHAICHDSEHRERQERHRRAGRPPGERRPQQRVSGRQAHRRVARAEPAHGVGQRNQVRRRRRAAQRRFRARAPAPAPQPAPAFPEPVNLAQQKKQEYGVEHRIQSPACPDRARSAFLSLYRAAENSRLPGRPLGPLRSGVWLARRTPAKRPAASPKAWPHVGAGAHGSPRATMTVHASTPGRAPQTDLPGTPAGDGYQHRGAGGF